jgi:predicted HAD superfamily phosphohydrolase YqeG
MGLKPAQVMMIGDSVFTDIAGANALGIWTALVDPLGKIDFVGTKVYRGLEYLLRLRRPLDSRCDYRSCPPELSNPAALE